MAIRPKKPSKPEIDLSGVGGNAFALLGYAAKLANELGKDGAEIQRRMKSGDYENLISVFDQEFGEYVDLVR